MSKHTDGPWNTVRTTAVDTKLDKMIQTAQGKPVAWAYSVEDANLIALVPELLEALEEAVQYLPPECGDLAVQYTALITRATCTS